MMRVWALGDQTYQEQKLAKSSKDEKHIEPDLLANQLTVTIICVTRPDSILRQLKEQYRFVQTEEPGIYYCDEVLEKWIIYPSELELIPKNYPLLSLAQGKKLDEFIALCLREGLNDYLQLIIDIGLATDPSVILQKILENCNMKPQIREETWPVIDQFFQDMPEALWKLPTFKNALTSFQQDARRQGEQSGLQQGELIGEQRAANFHTYSKVLYSTLKPPLIMNNWIIGQIKLFRRLIYRRLISKCRNPKTTGRTLMFSLKCSPSIY